MRTTINVDDGLLIEARQRAAQRGTTLTQIIEDALRESLNRREATDEAPFVTMTYRGGGLMPGVDLDDGAGLRERLGDGGGGGGGGGGGWSSPTSTS